jgi:hypothetical protein
VKKALCTVLALLLCLSACAALVSCGCDHTFATEWTADDTHHWHVCTQEDCGEQCDKAEHSWDAGVMMLLPTASTDGERKYTCLVCGKTRSEAVPADPLVSAAEWANAFLLQEENYRFSISVDGLKDILIMKKRDGVAMKNVPTSVNTDQTYYTVESGKYYAYTVSGEQVTKAEITQDDYAKATTLVELQQAFAYSAFTYNESNKHYVAAKLTVGDTVYENVDIAFCDKKINMITFTEKKQGASAAHYIFTVTYGTVSAGDIVLPQVTA